MDQKRHVEDRKVEAVHVIVEGVLTQLLTVVPGHDDHGVVQHPPPVQFLQEPSDLPVHPKDRIVVARCVGSPLRLVHVPLLRPPGRGS
jgi:hypothetical protein